VHKLDIAAVTRRVFRVLRDGPFLYRVNVLWLVLVFFMRWSTLALEPGATDDGTRSSLYYGSVTLASVAELIAFAACAVNVHRFILLGEQPVPIRAGRTEWRYFLRGLWVVPLVFLLIIGVAVVDVALPSARISGMLGGITSTLAAPRWSYAGALAWLGVELAMGILLVPLYMSLPAVAIGRTDFMMTDGLAVIPGNFLRLLAIYAMACVAPIAIVGLVASGIEYGISIIVAGPAFLVGTIKSAVDAGRDIANVMIWATMLSCAYAELVVREAHTVEAS
jgi:hypothetical protein